MKKYLFLFLISILGVSVFAKPELTGLTSDKDTDKELLASRRWKGFKIGETTQTINLLGIYKWERTRIDCSRDSDVNCLEASSTNPGEHVIFVSYEPSGIVANNYSGILDEPIIENDTDNQTLIEFVLKVEIEE